jgi:dihydroorotase
MTGYNTNLKVNPPLRTKGEKEALIQAVLNETVDCLASHHLPHEFDSKVIEFEYAKWGMIGLETAYAALNTAVPDITPERCVELLALNPRKIFGLDAATINTGSTASLTLFNPKQQWMVEEKDIKSKSSNSPFIGKQLTGKAAGIVTKGKIILT